MTQLWEEERVSTYPGVFVASDRIIRELSECMTIPKRFSLPMRDIWDLQFQLPIRKGRKAFKALEHAKFRAGYDFLLIRERSGELKPSLGEWWEKFQAVEKKEQIAMLKSVNSN